MKPAQLISALVTCLTLAACASTTLQGYEGAPRPDIETALISAARPSTDRMETTVSILTLDTPRGEVIRVRTRSIRVLPRETCIGVRARTSTLDYHSADLCFEPYAGSDYEVIAQAAGSPLPMQVQIEGDASGMVIDSQNGPFMITRVMVVDVATREIVAVSEP